MNVNVKLGQKVWFFRYDGEEDDFEIVEANVSRIDISLTVEDYDFTKSWESKHDSFIELNNGWFFDLKTDDNENFFVKNDIDDEDNSSFFGFTKEEAEQKVESIKRIRNMTEEEKEFELYKKLHKKFSDRI